MVNIHPAYSVESLAAQRAMLAAFPHYEASIDPMLLCEVRSIPTGDILPITGHKVCKHESWFYYKDCIRVMNTDDKSGEYVWRLEWYEDTMLPPEILSKLAAIRAEQFPN